MRIQLTHLELRLVCEEVFEEHQHVRGHHGNVGRIAVWSVGVAEAGAHRIVHKQHTGSLDLGKSTHTHTHTHGVYNSTLHLDHLRRTDKKIFCR